MKLVYNDNLNENSSLIKIHCIYNGRLIHLSKKVLLNMCNEIK